MLGIDGPVSAVLILRESFRKQNLRLKRINNSFMANTTKLSREERKKVETNRPQETQGGKAAEAPRLRSRIEEAEGQEVGPRPGEAVRAADVSIREAGVPPFENREGWAHLVLVYR